MLLNELRAIYPEFDGHGSITHAEKEIFTKAWYIQASVGEIQPPNFNGLFNDQIEEVLVPLISQETWEKAIKMTSSEAFQLWENRPKPA
jgi:hypothetical protein